MPFEKGQSGNPSGQKDRRKTRAQIAVTQFIDARADKLEGWLDRIDEKDGPKAAFQAFVSVLEFALPKLARKELAGDPDNPVHTVHRVELVSGDGTSSAPTQAD